MKRTGICTKCSGQRVIKVAMVVDGTDDATGGYGTPIYRREPGHPVPRAILATRNQNVCGFTEAYVCTECGWFEEYIAHPEKVEWKEIEGVWAKPIAPAPYR